MGVNGYLREFINVGKINLNFCMLLNLIRGIFALQKNFKMGGCVRKNICIE